MPRRTVPFTLMFVLIFSPISLIARPQQVTADSVATAQANAQAAQAQAASTQAAATQATAQLTAAENAFRTALTNYSKAPAGAAKTAAQAAVDQAQKAVQQAALTARNAGAQAANSRAAAARATAQANMAQALLARQTAAQQAAAQKAATQQAAPAATPATTSVAASTASTSSTAGKSSTAGASAAAGNSGANEFNTILGDITGNGGASGKSATGANGASSAATGTAAATGAANSFAGGSTMGAKSARGGSQPAASSADSNPTAGPARKAIGSGALGMGQSTDSLLTVYGCSRMGTQVICDTDFSNQNNTVTQVSSADQWKDVYLQDDAGDNHMRAMGVFENDNGDQRTQITLPYGEKSRYLLVFNGVPATVKTVKLKSTANVLDVEDIPVANPSEPAAQSTAAGPNQGTPGVQQATAPASKSSTKPPRS